MTITKELMQRIEGEADLELEWKEGVISHARMRFFNYRGIEEILKGRPLYDALVIAPRVCGICGHAHLISTANAIEDALTKLGAPPMLSSKAQGIREITLSCELIQSHIKWFYFNFIPELKKLSTIEKRYDSLSGKKWHNAREAAAQANRAAAVLAVQWPHSAYALPGGVSSDPSHLELIEVKRAIEEVKLFFEKEIVQCRLGHFLSHESFEDLLNHRGDLPRFLKILIDEQLATLGGSSERYLALASICHNPTGFKADTLQPASAKNVKESLEGTLFNGSGDSYAKSALYDGQYAEVGPLARQLIAQEPMITTLHKYHGGVLFVRILARMRELGYLIEHTLTELHQLTLDEPSLSPPSQEALMQKLKGEGVMEAARGSLIHRIEASKGVISAYEIITPTVWNLGNGDFEHPAILQHALKGLKTPQEAELLLRSFDLCSVCTTQ